MNRKTGALGVALTICLLLGGCASPVDSSVARPCGEIADAVQAGQTFEEMTPLSQKQVLQYLDLDEAQLADMAMHMDASRATAEVIVVLEAKDAQGLQAAEEALEAYRDSTLEQYRDYRPEEVPKLEQAVLKSKGMQAALIVAKDAQQAEKSLDDAWK